MSSLSLMCHSSVTWVQTACFILLCFIFRMKPSFLTVSWVLYPLAEIIQQGPPSHSKGMRFSPASAMAPRYLRALQGARGWGRWGLHLSGCEGALAGARWGFPGVVRLGSGAHSPVSNSWPRLCKEAQHTLWLLRRALVELYLSLSLKSWKKHRCCFTSPHGENFSTNYR